MVVTPVADAPEPDESERSTLADSVPVTRIMSQNVVCAREDVDVEALVDLMVRCRVGCIPIVDADGRAIGMVTKSDLIADAVAAAEPDAAGRALVAGDLMMPFVLKLGEHATIAHAVVMMAGEDVHYIPIVAASGCVIGVVSSMDIVRWLAANHAA